MLQLVLSPSGLRVSPVGWAFGHIQFDQAEIIQDQEWRIGNLPEFPRVGQHEPRRKGN